MIYKVVCSWSEIYNSETIGNVEELWEEHNNSMKKSSPSKHRKDNLDNVFSWSVLANAPKNMFQ